MLSITNAVRRLFARSAAPSRARRESPRRLLRLEFLEERTLLCNPGELDLTFDGDGKLTTDFGGVGAEGASIVVVQTDGKIVAAGTSVRSVNNYGTPKDIDWALARYNANGSLDTSFGSGGKVLTSFGVRDSAQDLAIQSDGKIVVVGSKGDNWQGNVQNWFSDVAVARYKPDGTLDKSFGKGGKVTTDLGGIDRAHAVAIQSDGKIVVAGRGGTNTVCPVADGCGLIKLLRYNTNGTLDNSFGSSGIVTLIIPGAGDGSTGISDLVLQPDGKIVVAGYSEGDALVVRYNTNGSLDSNFGVGGVVTTNLGTGADRFTSLAIQSNGNIVAAGGNDSPGDGSFFAAARYNLDGSLDTSFDGDGIVITNIAPSSALNGDNEGANEIAIQSDGRIVLAGRYSPDSTHTHSNFALIRYNSNGSLDTRFDSDGIVTTAIGSNLNDAIGGVAIQPSDGHIVVAGGSDGNFVLARYCP